MQLNEMKAETTIYLHVYVVTEKLHAILYILQVLTGCKGHIYTTCDSSILVIHNYLNDKICMYSKGWIQ